MKGERTVAKRVLGVILALLVILSMAGCSGGKIADVRKKADIGDILKRDTEDEPDENDGDDADDGDIDGDDVLVLSETAIDRCIEAYDIVKQYSDGSLSWADAVSALKAISDAVDEDLEKGGADWASGDSEAYAQIKTVELGISMSGEDESPDSIVVRVFIDEFLEWTEENVINSAIGQDTDYSGAAADGSVSEMWHSLDLITCALDTLDVIDKCQSGEMDPAAAKARMDEIVDEMENLEGEDTYDQGMLRIYVLLVSVSLGTAAEDGVFDEDELKGLQGGYYLIVNVALPPFKEQIAEFVEQFG